MVDRALLIHRTEDSVGPLNGNAAQRLPQYFERPPVIATSVTQSLLISELTVCDADIARNIRGD